MTPERFRFMVSSVLAIGVSISAGLVAFGFATAFVVGWQGSLLGRIPVDTSMTDFANLVDGLAALRPQAISQLGLVTLVATPIVRVVASLVGFALERDRLYVALTAVVLAILLASALFIR